MSQTSEISIFRVTVKGKFADLTEQARRYLVDAAPEHTYFTSAYTPEGTFVYDADIMFFSLRYEVRCAGPDAADAASAVGMTEAQSFMNTMGFGYTKLRASVVDLATMWTA